MSKFYIKKATNGLFYFTLAAKNGETILTGETYSTKQGCKNGIESVVSNSPYEFNYRKHLATNGQYYFTLVASNHEVIGTSEMYIYSSSRDNGIASVKENAPKAEIIDLALVTY